MFSEGDYIKALHSMYTDPTEYDGYVPKCCKDGCYNEIELDDDVCYDHQLCDDCSEYNYECRCSFFIDQYNRNRPHNEHIKSITEIDY